MRDIHAAALVDSHIHFADMVNETDVDLLIGECGQAGIGAHFNMGTCVDDWRVVLDAADKHTNVHPFIGLHPWYADRWPGCSEQLSSIWSRGDIGMGEIGLDRLRGPDIETQVACFRWQLESGLRLNRPISVHCVRMWGQMLEILAEYAPLNRRVAIHAYGGSADTARQLEKMGAMLSFCATVLQSDRPRLHKAVRCVSADHILLETDAPALLPRCDTVLKVLLFADGREYNHPVNLVAIAERVAELRGVTSDELTEQVNRNSVAFYSGVDIN